MQYSVESGSVRPKTCKACRCKFTPVRPLQTVCGPQCAADLAARQRKAHAVAKAKEERKAIKARKEALKGRRDYLKEAQVAFNQWVRLRDQLAGHTCISSGRPLDWSSNSVDAGHYRSVGSAPHLRFHPDNCHAQSKQDNRYGAGKAVDYRLGLIQRIGVAAVEALEADQTDRKYTIDDLKRIKEEFSAMARKLRLNSV